MSLPDFPQATKLELESIFYNSISEKSRDRMDKGEKQTADSLKIDKVIVALSMQYTQRLLVDISFLESELSRLSSEGIKTVLIAGITGEYTHLNKLEHINYVRLACKRAKNHGINVIAGAGSNNTKEQREVVDGILGGNFKTKDLNVLSSDGPVATLLFPPYYKTDNVNLIRHFVDGLNRGPAIIYSIKARTGMEIPLEVIEILSKHPNFIGVKECDGPERIKYLVNKGITVWTGNDDTMVQDVNQLGGYGVITVTGNIVLDSVQEIIKYGKMSGFNVDRNKIASKLLLPADPIMIHSVTSIQRYDGKSPIIFRLPTGPISEEQQKWALKYMRVLGLGGSIFGDNYQTSLPVTKPFPKSSIYIFSDAKKK